MAVRNDKLILVCDKCFRACCWYGDFMCDEARGAGLVVMTAGDLRKLTPHLMNAEHPENWSATKMTLVYGEPTPRFSERRISFHDALEMINAD